MQKEADRAENDDRQVLEMKNTSTTGSGSLLLEQGYTDTLKDGTKYRYRLDLNNLWVKAKYHDYKLKNEIPEICALTGDQRKAFESALLGYLAKIYRQETGRELHYPFTPEQEQTINGICERLV